VGLGPRALQFGLRRRGRLLARAQPLARLRELQLRRVAGLRERGVDRGPPARARQREAGSAEAERGFPMAAAAARRRARGT